MTHDCATLAAGASCTANVVFFPRAAGAIGGALTFQASSGNVAVPLSGTGELSLTGHYYQSILRRAPDAGGQAFWDGEAARLSALGANVNETWFAMAMSFYGSAEYAALNRDDSAFVNDLYVTFFDRTPDPAGLAYWTQQLASGMPRGVVLASFMFSPEFDRFATLIFGTTTARGEVDMVMDFYRGILGRMPDDAGFNYWVQRFRAAQCGGQGSGAISDVAEEISSLFVNSSEYLARSRSAAEFVGDLYNAFLRRGGDLGGVQFWLGKVQSGELTREYVRSRFVISTEFRIRTQRVTGERCLP